MVVLENGTSDVIFDSARLHDVQNIVRISFGEAFRGQTLNSEMIGRNLNTMKPEKGLNCKE